MTSIDTLLTDHLDLWTSAIARKSSAGRGRSKKFSLYGIDKLRALILDLAVRGKLVSQDPADEPASDLLKTISREKQNLVLQGAIRKAGPLAAVESSEHPFELPQNWDWVRFGDVVEIVRGITFPGNEKSRVPEHGRAACLRTTNVQHEIEWDDILYIREQYITRNDQILREGDLVMSMANSRELVGKVAIVEGKPNQTITFGGFLGVLRPILIERRFVLDFLRSPFARASLIDGATQTTNIANISIGKLRPMIIGLPPIAEQHRIVAKVDELMALCDRLEAGTCEAIEAHQLLVTELLATLSASRHAGELAENWARVEAHFDTLFVTEDSVDQLKQTILQLAVKGTLVPQDPKDEPFSGRGFPSLSRLRNNQTSIENLETSDLPTGWQWREFGKMGEIIGGGTPSKSVSEYWEGQIPWVSPKDMKVDYIHDAVDKISELAVQRSAVKIVPQNYLLIVVRGMILAHSFPAAITATSVTINQDMKAVEIGDLNPRYVLLLMKAMKPHFVGLVDRSSHGTCKLVSNKLWSTKLPIPPADEQDRIVAKANQLLDLCDGLREKIEGAGICSALLADTVVANAVK